MAAGALLGSGVYADMSKHFEGFTEQQKYDLVLQLLQNMEVRLETS